MSRPARFALALGFAFGLALGLYYGWVVSPVQYTDTEPASLRADYKAEMALMAAEVFAADGDLDGAQARLAALGPAREAIPAAFETALAAGKPQADLRRLAALAAALDVATPAMRDYLR